ncbi:hypothetical protein NC651_032737 [Populus alba x Populus x berolinensis]|nr:hypothetical protein NC651_032737 [Populus alba x Populus x berolinensis]
MNSSDQQMNSIAYMEPKLYKAAEAGNINPFKDRLPTSLSELLTPQKNTILHVYLENQRRGSKSTDFVGQILERCPPLLLQANKKGEIPLHLAARYGHSNVVRVLIDRAKARSTDLERGATEAKNMLRMVNEENDTALHVAARNIQAQVVKILTKKDPEFSYSANVHGETPLYIAANMRFDGKFKRHEENRKNVIKYILSNCELVEYCGSHGRTALHAAAMHGDHETARKILKRDPSLTGRTEDEGWSPLHYAAFFPNSSHGGPTVKVLLEHDVSAAYIVDSEKRTALHKHAYKKMCGLNKQNLSVDDILVGNFPEEKVIPSI